MDYPRMNAWTQMETVIRRDLLVMDMFGLCLMDIFLFLRIHMIMNNMSLSSIR